jgi:hypothetical protein
MLRKFQGFAGVWQVYDFRFLSRRHKFYQANAMIGSLQHYVYVMRKRI